MIITAYDNGKETTNKKYVRRKLREYGFRFSEMFGRQIETYFSSNINTFNKTGTGKHIVVEGYVRVYGYKIEGESLNCGFYDVFNRRLYSKKDIENATIVEHESTYLHNDTIVSRMLKR